METKLIQDIIQWDVVHWSKALPFWEKFIPKQGAGKIAAAFGEREGGISLWLAQKGFTVNCSDYHDNLSLAKALHQEYNVDDLIQYSQQDISQTTFESNYFDVVVFKSVLGALGDKKQQEKAIKELHRILKPGGVLIFAENLQATKTHQYLRKKFTSWGDRWRYIKPNEIKEMFSCFSECNFSYNGFIATFGRNENRRKLLSKIEYPFLKLIPNSWKYILFGVCMK